MILFHYNKFLRLTALGGVFLGGVFLLGAGAQNAFADAFSVTPLAPGAQAPTATTYYENFDHVSTTGGALTTSFNGSSIKGTYSGDYMISPATQYGGANGSNYIRTTGSSGVNASYSLALDQSVNYFGLWFSALDPGNSLRFYNGNNLVNEFTRGDFVNMVGACPSKSAYCGNPNGGLDASEQFAYLNFYDSTGTFNKIVFNQDGNGGQFESDNQSVALLTSDPSGDPPAIPEPTTLFLFGTGLVGFASLYRRRIMTATQL